MNFNSFLISKQVPQHIAEAYPRFLEFLGAYYDFLENYKFDIEIQKDVDRCSNRLLQFLKKELAARFPKPIIDERKFLRTIKELYSRKGTIDSIELLFRLFFNETITIKEPSKNILKVSDGKWFRNNFFTIRINVKYVNSFEEPGNKPSYFIVNNAYGNFRIDVENYIEINSSDARLFYRGFNYLKLNVDDKVLLYSQANQKLLEGNVINSPSSLKILKGGKNWLRGQVFRIRGSTKDTIARVTNTDTNGAITKLEIYEYGYDHSLNQTFLISPYPNKPNFDSYEYTNTLISNNPLSYAHNLIINETTQGFREEIIGTFSGNISSSYFLQDYASQDYAAVVVIHSTFETNNNTDFSGITNPDLTLEEWNESQALLTFEQSTIVKARGEFFDDSGQVSNPEIRLQDNYFYQLFSYVIETKTPIENYRNVLELIHPAGLKYFSDLNKITVFEYNESINTTRNLSLNKIYLLDTASANDTRILSINKNAGNDLISTNSDINNISITKNITTNIETATSISWDANKQLDISSTADDVIQQFEINKQLNTSTTINDVIQDINLSIYVDDIAYANNYYNAEDYFLEIYTFEDNDIHFNANKQLNILTIVDDNSSNINNYINNYTLENYFAEDYFENNISLQIG